MARILFVGDDAAERETLALVMEFAGHRCRMAGSLQEVSDLLEKDSFDLVLIDRRPNCTAPEYIVKCLKDVFPELAVMILTESPASDMKEADEVLTTPCPLEEILSRIDRLLYNCLGHTTHQT